MQQLQYADGIGLQILPRLRCKHRSTTSSRSDACERRYGENGGMEEGLE